MGSCVVDNCCFCIDLRVGSLIIGYLSLVGNFLMAIAVGISITAGSVLISQNAEVGKSDDLKGLTTQEVGGIFLAIGIILLIILLVNLTFTIVLLVGLHKEKRGHVKAFLIFNMICIVLMIIQFLGSFAGEVTASSITQRILTILLSAYFWVVIKSYWAKMGEVAKNPRNYTA